MAVPRPPTQQVRQEIFVRDLLHNGDDQSTGLFEYRLVVPLRIQLAERFGHGVVQPQQDRLEHREHGMRVRSVVACTEKTREKMQTQ